tara:strand:- start:236 stop:880 length:645 start_codon:yes stop_codon:yes gene_type:complete
LIIIIPAYNPPNKFYDLIIEIYNLYNLPIIIVDDGSYTKIKKSKYYTLLVNNINMGKGYSLKKAFNYAIKRSYTHAITLDCDFQHDPLSISDFIDSNINYDIVLGKREFNNSMPLSRRFSNYLSSLILSLITKTKIFDSQCGFRRYNLDALSLINTVENGFQFESEILIKLLNNGGTLGHVHIKTNYNNEKSNINKFSDSKKFIMMIFKYIYEN